MTTIWRIFFCILFAFVTWATLTPNPENTDTGLKFAAWLADLFFSNKALADKIAHFLAYGALGFTAFPARGRALKSNFVVPVALPVYGMMLELVQGIGGVREPSIWDAVANASGAFFGYYGAYIAFNLLRRLS